MFKKLITFLLITASCYTYAQSAVNIDGQRNNMNSNKKAVMPIGTHEQERQLTQLIEQCLALINEEPTYRTIKALPQDQPHPQEFNLRKCQSYIYATGKEGINQDIPEKREQILKLYEKIYLSIYSFGLRDILRPLPPRALFREFNKETGLQVYLNDLDEKGLLNNDNRLEKKVMFFGSKEKMEQAEHDFFQRKIQEYHIGED